MSVPNFQSIQNKLFPIINQELPKYMGQTNFVSKYIPEIFVGVSQGAIGGDLDNTAFNLKNMYGGTSLGGLNIFNDYPRHESRVFKMEPEEYYIGIDINRIEEINELYSKDEKKAGEEILNYIAQKLVSRLGLLRERNLAAKVTDSSLYGSSNTVDLTAKAISSWTETDIDNFFSSFIDLAKYLNYAVGGNLFNDQMEVQNNGQKLYIVIPIDVYVKLQGLFRLFSNYVSMIGNSNDGKYKAFKPDIFNAVTSGITVVGTAFRVADDHEVDQKYQLENLTDIWTGSSIYMFTTSSNILDMASIKEVVYLNHDIKEVDILGNNLWRSRTKRCTVASNPYGFCKIDLKLADA
ncbi:phage capsid protein [Brachyspira pilosicoli]|uniref:phage capsid protein n=1 Tax=Brachyspira pilosicoli TaxID=52584 RepID=UPI002543CEAA|nr:phage capsid protein [Brachyspira pilosicoli]WIH85244.1 phage capsid protein [Brachyspira pilosicoli]